MKATRSLFVAVVLMIVLSACGAVNSFVPDQDVQNAFGLDEKEVVMQGVSTSPEGLTTQQVVVTSVFEGPIQAEFPDFDDSDIPSGIRPNGISENITFETTVTMVSPSGADNNFPEALTITEASLDVKLADGSGAPSLTKSYASPEGVSVTMTKTGCMGTGPINCTYTIGTIPSTIIALSVTGSDFDTLYEIMTGGANSNTLNGNFSVTFDQEIPLDTEVSVTLETSGGKLTF